MQNNNSICFFLDDIITWILWKMVIDFLFVLTSTGIALTSTGNVLTLTGHALTLTVTQNLRSVLEIELEPDDVQGAVRRRRRGLLGPGDGPGGSLLHPPGGGPAAIWSGCNKPGIQPALAA